jgi:signal recognition particle receptor subunit beta
VCVELTEAGLPSQEIATLQEIEKGGDHSTVDALVLLVDRTNPRSLKYAEDLYVAHILQCAVGSTSRTRLSSLPVIVLHTKADLPQVSQVLMNLTHFL